MNQGTILHLLPWDKKFVLPFIDLVHKHFDNGLHRFIVYGLVGTDELTLSNDTTICTNLLKNSYALSKSMHNAEKIILHGLFNIHLVYILAFQPWLLKKCCWVLWGGDLYVHNKKNKDWHWFRKELFRKIVIKHLSLITTTVPGDYELVKEWYNTKAQFIQNLMYYSHIARLGSSERVGDNKIVMVQIGNSSDPSNNHREIINNLANYTKNDFVVFAPLSYGDECYKKEIISYGIKRLGNKFIPITNFVSFSQYTEYLKSIDVAIFNHKRQQGMGNLIGLLSLGKKVYIRSDVTPWKYMNELGITLYDTKGKLDLNILDDAISKRNMEIATKVFSENKLVSSWNIIFNQPFSDIGRTSLK